MDDDDTKWGENARLADPCPLAGALSWSAQGLLAVVTTQTVQVVDSSTPALRCVANVGLQRGGIASPLSKYLLDSSEDLADEKLLDDLIVRSIPTFSAVGWSPIGVAPNMGCVLCVSSSDGVVTLHAGAQMDILLSLAPQIAELTRAHLPEPAPLAADWPGEKTELRTEAQDVAGCIAARSIIPQMEDHPADGRR
ncbi:hypothetical protein T484DRAFT_1883454 [Baffinella frigidus]|nr:hypothetical protein T484DRAFT_1883454 [Cryptophyta sp. CCMP2293]